MVWDSIGGHHVLSSFVRNVNKTLWMSFLLSLAAKRGTILAPFQMVIRLVQTHFNQSGMKNPNYATMD